MSEYQEEVTRKCFVIKMLLKIPQNSRETPVLQLYSKRGPEQGFSWKIRGTAFL